MHYYVKYLYSYFVIYDLLIVQKILFNRLVRKRCTYLRNLYYGYIKYTIYTFYKVTSTHLLLESLKHLAFIFRFCTCKNINCLASPEIEIEQMPLFMYLSTIYYMNIIINIVNIL